jgi:hypothetical protein
MKGNTCTGGRDCGVSCQLCATRYTPNGLSHYDVVCGWKFGHARESVGSWLNRFAVDLEHL